MRTHAVPVHCVPAQVSGKCGAVVQNPNLPQEIHQMDVGFGFRGLNALR